MQKLTSFTSGFLSELLPRIQLLVHGDERWSNVMCWWLELTRAVHNWCMVYIDKIAQRPGTAVQHDNKWRAWHTHDDRPPSTCHTATDPPPSLGAWQFLNGLMTRPKPKNNSATFNLWKACTSCINSVNFNDWDKQHYLEFYGYLNKISRFQRPSRFVWGWISKFYAILYTCIQTWRSNNWPTGLPKV